MDIVTSLQETPHGGGVMCGGSRRNAGMKHKETPHDRRECGEDVIYFFIFIRVRLFFCKVFAQE
jgi:hypothetical protein